ncbi:MAG: NADP-dependent phosphogluconate dehydrogenase [Pseudomonadota bacterium]
MTTHHGLVGLGTMGAALALNIADNGFDIAVYNRTASRTQGFLDEAGDLRSRLTGCDSLRALVAAITPPRTIILMVPAGDVVDDMIAQIGPLLSAGDTLVDAGNANFHDTNRRAKQAEDALWDFIGLGVSGGEDGARNGPSMMAGCAPKVFGRAQAMLQAIAAKHADGTRCVALMGAGGAGHFVKMVHNGIEYADMQMIAEMYGLMRDGHGMAAPAIGDVFSRFNDGLLRSYLIEISAAVAKADDDDTGKPMLDVILDAAGQKGTGRWTAIEAQHVAIAIPVIEAAVTARNLSAQVSTRAAMQARFGVGPMQIQEPLAETQLEGALIAGKIICYAQGFSMLSASDAQYGWTLPLPEIARVWREGCIIRSAMLDDMATALEEGGTQNLILAPYFAELVEKNVPTLRKVVEQAVSHGISVPALSSALSWFDMIRTARGTANMIQGQRDYFGAHGFKRLDKDGDFNGPWSA